MLDIQTESLYDIAQDIVDAASELEQKDQIRMDGREDVWLIRLGLTDQLIAFDKFSARASMLRR